MATDLEYVLWGMLLGAPIGGIIALTIKERLQK